MKVQSVLGDLAPHSLGMTLTHEHLSMNFERFLTNAPDHLNSYFNKSQKISLKNVGMLRQYPYSSKYNTVLDDEDSHEKVIEDVKLLKRWCPGNCTIVENTTCGIKRDLTFYRFVAEETGVNVIAGTGHYVGHTQTDSVLSMSLEKMVDLYTKEIVTGVDVGILQDGKDIIKCGLIGEVGSRFPLSDFEKRTIRATAETQAALGCPVSFHPARDPKAPFEILRIYLEAGGNIQKCVMSHLDRTLHNIDVLLEFAKLGAYCQFDLFGTEVSYYQLCTEMDMPSDAQRMDRIVCLVSEGFEDRITISHDIHTKHRLSGFGGHGYAHIYNNVLPKLGIKGLTDKQIEKITVHNPANWLQFDV